MERSWGNISVIFTHLGFIKIISNVVLKGLRGTGEESFLWLDTVMDLLQVMVFVSLCFE